MSNFGFALEKMRAGYAVQRESWVKGGKFLYYIPDGRYSPCTDIARGIAKYEKDNLVPYHSYIAVCTLSDPSASVEPYVPSQSDILSDDWKISEPVVNVGLSIEEVVGALKRGCVARRQAWMAGLYITLTWVGDKYDFPIRGISYNEIDGAYDLSTDDMDAKDWIIVDEKIQG